MKRLRLLSFLLAEPRAGINQARGIAGAFKYYHSQIGQESRDRAKNRRNAFFAIILSAAGITAASLGHKKLQALSRGKKGPSTTNNLPVYTRKEVAQHDSLEKEVWITYKGVVYDITNFIKHHPGGSHTIMMGAGGDVEPFWQTYTVHEASEVQNLLSTYKIGVLPDEEKKTFSNDVHTSEGPYANDPKRSPLLKVLTKEPFNAESPPKLLVATRKTPNEIFFVRNHLPVPEVDLESYRLSVCLGTDGNPDGQKVLAEFSLDDLRTKFKQATIESVVQCSGNRRTDLKKIREIKGLDWSVGAMGNASWTGVKLVDLFESLGLEPSGSIKHVQFEGLDCDMSGQAYGASVSADVAFDPNRGAILAYEMNGQPLTRDHGFPLRFVAPGITGARNVKWLSKIILSHEESNGHWQRNDYKSFSPSTDMFDLDYTQAISIQEMPVQSAICDPLDGENIFIKLDKSTDSKPTVTIKGYAYSGGGKMIVRVDISIDGGTTWLTANLLDLPRKQDGTPDFDNRNQVGSWSRWTLDLPIPQKLLDAKEGSLEILCRAFDSAYNSQPERAETIWNVRGVVNNSWHRVRIHLNLD